MKRFLVPTFAVLALASACSSNSDSGSSPSQACLDMADVVAKAAQRCGQDYQANYKAFIQNAAKGDCANITSVRDENALRNTCFPSIQSEACQSLVAGVLDPTCKSQLVHASMQGELGPASR